jgi:RHS repeat-associated protein
MPVVLQVAANHLTSAGGAAYTWDARGNLVSDGTFTYTYDAAGRMVRAESVTLTLVYTYNSAGLRVAQSVDGDVTTFAWDWASGVPEMLSEGQAMGSSIALYLVGHETLGRWDGADWTYYLRDALGSIRQETDGTGGVTDSREWTPFGMEVGTAQEGLGYAGEWWDVHVGLLYLRARWYEPQTGRFTRRDPWEGSPQQPGTNNGFNYVMGNPIHLKDPTGLQVDSPGARFMACCFDLHSISHGAGTPYGYNPYYAISAEEAVRICTESYNMNNWNRNDFRLGGSLPERAHDLFGWFLFNWRGTYNTDRLFFDGNQALTRELAHSVLINVLRIRYYNGEDLSGPTHYDYNRAELAGASLDSLTSLFKNKSLSLSFVMGSFWYQIKAVGSNRIGFRIDNDMTLESGSHIAFRFRPEYAQTVEDLITQDPGLKKTPLYLLIADERYELISILSSRTRAETVGSQGGGSLYQTFTWTENRHCEPRGGPHGGFFPLDIQVWKGFQSVTEDPEGFPPADNVLFP